jgi:O-antigen/teichoic acid export membrane protein
VGRETRDRESSIASLLPRVARNASFNLAQQLWLAVLSLAATPVLYESLGPGAYGLFAIVNIVTTQFGALELGFGHATTRFVAAAAGRGDTAATRRTVSTAGAVFLVAGAVGAVSIAALSEFLIDSYFLVPVELRLLGRRVLLLSAVLFAVSIQSNLYGAVWRGVQKFDTLNLLRAGAGTAQTIGAVAIAVAGGALDHVVAWSVAVAAASALAHLALLRKEDPALVPWPVPDRPTFRSMRSLSVVLLGAGVLSQLYLAGGALVLGRSVGVDLLPLYSIPLGLFQRLLLLPSGLANALFPAVAEASDARDRQRLNRINEQGTRLLALAAVPVVVTGVLLARPFLTLWLGTEFASGATFVLQAFLVAFGIATVTVPGTELARGGARPQRLVMYTALLAATNIGGALLLTPRFGVAGAAAALPLAQAAGSAYLTAASGHGRSILVGLRAPAVLGLAYAGMTAAVGAAVDGFFERALAAVGLTVAYAAVAFRFSLEEDQRRAMLRLLPGRR